MGRTKSALQWFAGDQVRLDLRRRSYGAARGRELRARVSEWRGPKLPLEQPSFPRSSRPTGSEASLPAAVMQIAVASFLAEGHLRKMRRLYAERSAILSEVAGSTTKNLKRGGLALVINLPQGIDDAAIVQRARTVGLAPSPLSSWYADKVRARPGLLLGVTNATAQVAETSWKALQRIIGEVTQT